MKIKIEKRKVVGQLHTRFGTFPMLFGGNVMWSEQDKVFIAHDVVDAEGFQTNLAFTDGYYILPDPFRPEMDVKIALYGVDETVPFDDGANPDEALELESDDVVVTLNATMSGEDYSI